MRLHPGLSSKLNGLVSKLKGSADITTWVRSLAAFIGVAMGIGVLIPLSSLRSDGTLSPRGTSRTGEIESSPTQAPGITQAESGEEATPDHGPDHDPGHDPGHGPDHDPGQASADKVATAAPTEAASQLSAEQLAVTHAPATLTAAFDYVSGRTGLKLDAGLAIVGDAAHGNKGYHVGWDRLMKSAGSGDYSVRESPRDAHPTNAAMAFDIWNWDRLREFSLWLVAQCEANTADTQDIREVIYTPDGRTVRRWDRLGVRSSGDASHLKHTHISYFRDSENTDKVGLFARFFAERVEPAN